MEKYNFFKQRFSNKKSIIILMAIIALSIVLMLYVGFRKSGFFIDELYSYFLSNSFKYDKISNDPNVWNCWVNGNDFINYIVVNKGEQFAFDRVYINNSFDSHPPLFYFILHFVSSLFIGKFSKWYGLIINIFFLVGSEILIYKISRKIIKEDVLSFLPVVLYGFSPYAIDTCMYIRMYMMLTFFTLLYIYYNIKLFEEDFSYKNLIIVDIIIYLGSMTQYYFIVIAFFITLINALYLLRNKRIKDMFIYGLGACISIILVYISFPYIVSQVTGSQTNNVGNEIVNELFNFKLFISMLFSSFIQVIKKITFNKYLSVFILFIIIIFYVFNVKKYKTFDKISLKIGLAVLLSYIFICYIGGHYVYIRYFYNIIPLFFILFVNTFIHFVKNKKIFVFICIVFVVINSIVYACLDKCEYVYCENKEYNKILSNHNDNLVVYNKKITSMVPVSSLIEYSLFDNVYLGTNKIEEDNMVIDLLKENNEIVIYINNVSDWGSGFETEDILSNLNSYVSIKATPIMKNYFGEYYLLETNK